MLTCSSVPVCKCSVELSIGLEEDGEILSGTLKCVDYGVEYPIEDGIPNMLPREHPEQA